MLNSYICVHTKSTATLLHIYTYTQIFLCNNNVNTDMFYKKIGNL